ncbi:MAG: hypothetical protein A4S09_04890 [Proteobacteria bacterium SG_bin7]|nr:MAG: hypothetical protein A4S09_04890 [Proteobacteria bacterium SG_bin7]
MKNLVLVGVALFLITGCSSTPEKQEYISVTPTNIEPVPDKVLSRIDNMEERPNWVKESEPFYVERGTVYSLGITTIREDQRVEAAYRVASNNAKHVVSQAITQRLSYVFQRGEENEGFNDVTSKYIGAEASELTTSHLKPSRYYWEKVSQSENGQRQIVYKVFALVTIPEVEFKKSVIAAAKKAEGGGKVSKDFDDKLQEHWQDFVRSPASDDKAE